jgi:hypothetical protein
VVEGARDRSRERLRRSPSVSGKCRIFGPRDADAVESSWTRKSV